MPISADRCKETSTSTGTGDVTLAGAAAGFASFLLSIGVGPSFYYCIAAQTPGEWETGIGHLSDADTLVRDSVVASSNSGSLVNFSAGTKDVFATWPGAAMVDAPTSAVDGEAVLFSGTSGKEFKRSTLNAAVVKSVDGVHLEAVAGADYGRYEYLPRILSGSAPASSLRRYSVPVAITTTQALTANRLYLTPVYASLSSLARIAAFVTAAVGGTSLRLGLYASASNGTPTGAAIYDSGSISSASTGTKEYTVSPTYNWSSGGLYWFGVESDGAPTLRATANTVAVQSPLTNMIVGLDGTDQNTITTQYKSLYLAHTYGALPDLTGASFTHYDVTITVAFSVD